MPLPAQVLNSGIWKTWILNGSAGKFTTRKLLLRPAKACSIFSTLPPPFREEKENDDAYRKVHLEATQLLAYEVENSDLFECFVHVSTVGVHGHIEVDRADENYRFAPGDGYQRTKLEGEQWIEKYATEKNIPFSIIPSRSYFRTRRFTFTETVPDD